MSKGKAPAFQFYASDFLTDTAEYEAISVGAYIRLLSTQWVNGSVPDDINKLSRIAGVSKSQMDEIWKEIEVKFEQKNGRLVNKKLEKIRKEKNKFMKNASDYGKQGADKRWGKDSQPDSLPYTDPNRENMALHSSSSTSSSPSISNSISKKGTPTEYGNAEVSEVVNYLKEKLGGISLDGSVKDNRNLAWHLINKIKKDYPGLNAIDSIKAIIDRGLKDKFHGKNITSIPYIYRNLTKIINSIKNDKSKSPTSSDMRSYIKQRHDSTS